MDFVRTFYNDCRVYVAAHPKVTLFTLAILAAVELRIIQRAWRKIFVFFEVKLSKRLNAKLRRKKQQLFEALFRPDAGREGAPLRVVEIGLGGGSNFDFYPHGTEIVGVDPNPDYLKYLHQEMDTSSGQRVTMTNVICAGAEEMGQHIEENSVDAVVATLVLCTVQDVRAVVDSCRFVLRPGGVFLFLHHNKADSETHPWKAMVQDWITPLTFLIADGCHFDRDPIHDIQNAGFSSVSYEKYTPGGTRFAPLSPVYPLLIGTAVK